MRPIVIDASMAAAWTLDDEKSVAGERILHEVRAFLRITTTLFWHEYRSILIANQKRRRVSQERIPAMLREVRALEIAEYQLDDDEVIIALAFQYNLSAYDAAYLALALKENAILATNDKKLAQAALTCGLELRTVLDGIAS
ncbi:hypothetical protein AXK11_02190 [Cephaloticoccus primus]|uniref:PIN domain-containing protein n=1 Tax=Cephaloticoccus primus TaxID=1548207 RepID=A0A139SSI9_9BACT|nr:type II toxin-antitoxin system VapC family toxin [Cephaloticoccus primus]KXU37526.1 hypothetical protein AXK11_02190 [Cephaloticoccus primus]